MVEDQLRCTKDDEFIVRSCTCPECTVERENSDTPYSESEVIITDEYLSPKIIGKWNGHNFKCPRCRLYSLLHTFNYCPNCGVKIKIQSVALSKFIKDAEAMGVRL